MTNTDERLDIYRHIWENKPVLREIYTDLYQRIAAQLAPGKTLEIGSGCGNLKNFASDVITSDVLPAPWIDVVADAQALPFEDGSFANIVLFDVLHHIERPRLFLSEAMRVLRPGGRIVMVEPGITPVSWLFFKLLHHEPVIMGDDPLEEGAPTPGKDPYLSNQAIPTLLMGRWRKRMLAAFPGMRVVTSRNISLFAYPLSGGFKRWCLIPLGLIRPLLAMEKHLEPLIGRLCAFRLLAVLEKKTETGAHES
ncbi:MAG TPA: SAM-dependent methyltransferase [Rhodospirillaceae bacterium]|nr:MAG: methyltransferase [Alphaproteobacteria bacterium GWF2_58_20]HAU29446.1 SAM-dependent methyltransferase [Rhodospirillaceae bacterium]